MRELAWALQALILTAGIHLFLRFVRTTRGIRLIRGLFVTVLVGVVGLWGLSKFLGLEELEHLLQGGAGLVVVTFAIIFQPELRRAVAQLGEHSLVGRLMTPSRSDTIHRVVRAAQSMASKRIGALIAFEREVSLGPYVEADTEIDCAVRANLLESIFYPGSPLHDGAVVVRKDRIALAGCFFPLTRQAGVDARLGTRHRAALGLTEDTDAIVLVVSEESGSISLAREGRMYLDVAADRVEEELREFIQTRSTVVEKESRGWARDLSWLPASLLLACGILYVAHQDIRTTRDFSVTIAGAVAGAAVQPSDGQILVVLPGASHRLVTPKTEAPYRVRVDGTRAQLEEIGGQLSGVFEVTDPDWRSGPLPLDRITWRDDVLGLGYEWDKEKGPPLLEIDEYATERLTLTAASLRVDPGQLNPRYEVRRENVRFEPGASVALEGPSSELAELEPDLQLFEPIVLTEDETRDHVARLRLTQDLRDRGFSVEPPTTATIPIVPAQREAGTLTREIALVCMDPARMQEVSRWKLPANAQTARFTIETSGLIPATADPGSALLLERVSAIKRFVEENLIVFVDLAELPLEGTGRTLPVRVEWRSKDLDSLDFGEALSGREELRVRLDSDETVLLEQRTPEEPERPAMTPQGGSRK